MVFSSLTFWFFYLPAVLLCYFVVPRKFRNWVLFFVSLAFYGWGEPIYIVLMLVTILINYLAGLLIAKFRENPGMKCLWLVLSVVLNLGFLVFFKYSGMIVDTLNLLPRVNIVFDAPSLPIGISFYTFQAMSYTIDVYREDTPEQKNPMLLSTYVTLFPQLIAGPIVRYRDVADQLTGRRETVEKFSKGVILFLVGLSKKILLANQFAAMWQNLGAENTEGILARWGGLVALTLQIYFDFSGYSDMARGLGKMLGFEFMENFNYPYISKSITDFWRRWHISLSTWFRDYLYIPLGGNRRGMGRQILNLFIVWAATGIWHGAAYNFLLWGLYFFVLLVLEKFFLLKVLKKIPGVFSHIYALFFIMIGWAIFNFENMGELFSYLGGLFSFSEGLFTQEGLSVLLSYLPITLVGMVLSTPILRKFYYKWQDKKFFPFVICVFAVAVMLLCTASLVNDSYNPFIYFRF
ncbi:MAG: MBOAT family O-acyltransferase [Eubacteriales bacterium]|nr:MBOAT family O-acyltransferase [Eubacteriales bacterium]